VNQSERTAADIDDTLTSETVPGLAEVRQFSSPVFGYVQILVRL
jgi:hypothetical protein